MGYPDSIVIHVTEEQRAMIESSLRYVRGLMIRGGKFTPMGTVDKVYLLDACIKETEVAGT